ncbi:hypothetical protein Fmac_008253 [Flemingia macrophylla]|uniref:TIR domain-containing protein n=1 Tax=Flemingia macrophylla TaxID=520843 RepID=A0ABD1MWV3_9FABA
MLYFLGSCLFLYVLFFFASWLFQKLKGGVAEENEKAMPELELDNNTPQVKYDVFVSFRGEDVRSEFLSHLTEAFQREKIKAFVDDKNLKREKKYGHHLLQQLKDHPFH